MGGVFGKCLVFDMGGVFGMDGVFGLGVLFGMGGVFGRYNKTSAEEERRAWRVELLENKRNYQNEEESETARTHPTWTEVDCTPSGSENGALHEDEDFRRRNQWHFQSLLKAHPERSFPFSPFDLLISSVDEFKGLLSGSPFFTDFEGRVEAGRKIGEGGQAKIHEVLFDGEIHPEFLLKVFETAGSSLSDLQRSWVSEFAKYFLKRNGLNGMFSKSCAVICNGTLLKDGRFAFVMLRCWGDLRKAIDSEVMKDSSDKKPPFPLSISIFLMFQIGLGMKELHAHGILHRDLKAANVLLYKDLEYIISTTSRREESFLGFNNCIVSDYESCVGVIGTGFWRAPEVLDAVKNKAKDKETNPKIWTKKVDVYSYAMTCYEILAGCNPFQTRMANDYEGVIRGERPPLPDYVDSEIRQLLRKCWHHEAEERPSFEEIEAELRRYIIKKRTIYEGLAEDEREVEDRFWLIRFEEQVVPGERYIERALPLIQTMVKSCNEASENSSLENQRGRGRAIRRPNNRRPHSQRGSKPFVPRDLGLDLPGLCQSDKKYGDEGLSNAI